MKAEDRGTVVVLLLFAGCLFAARTANADPTLARMAQAIDSPTSTAGPRTTSIHRDHELLVAMPRRLKQGEVVTVRVVNEGDLAVRRGRYNFWSLGTWAWYPRNALNGELATVDLEVWVPIEYTPFASGRVVSERDENQAYSIVETRLDKPMQFPVVAAGKYNVYSGTRDGITCRVATYTGNNESGARRLIDRFLAYEDDADVFLRRRLLYNKGPLVLHALRQQLGKDLGSAEAGDRAFVVLLRSFLKNFTYRWGATHHLVGILNQITQKDWQPWFEKYVYGTETPEVDL